MFGILFLPFILFETIASNIARNLNIAPPPQLFSQFSQTQGQNFLPPSPTQFIKSASISNVEEEEIERDERGFVIKRIIHRRVHEG